MKVEYEKAKAVMQAYGNAMLYLTEEENNNIQKIIQNALIRIQKESNY